MNTNDYKILRGKLCPYCNSIMTCSRYDVKTETRKTDCGNCGKSWTSKKVKEVWIGVGASSKILGVLTPNGIEDYPTFKKAFRRLLEISGMNPGIECKPGWIDDEGKEAENG